jgi:ketosteroid isomerase-like protein
MTEERLRAFFAAVSASDWETVEAALADDVSFEFPGRRFGSLVEGKRKVLVFLKRNQRMFREGLRFDVQWAGVLGDRGVAQWTNEGITREGEPYANRGVTLFTFRDGLAVEIRDYLDTERIADTWPS